MIRLLVTPAFKLVNRLACKWYLEQTKPRVLRLRSEACRLELKQSSSVWEYNIYSLQKGQVYLSSYEAQGLEIFQYPKESISSVAS